MRTALLLAIMIWGGLVAAQDFQTLTYLQTDSGALQLDLFLPDQPAQAAAAPLVIYVHGGGFYVGDRSEGHDLGRFLRKNGIACATISYNLTRKGSGFGCDVPQATKIFTFRQAASELWEATAFLRSRATSLRLDTTQIFIAGSSAGAETVLHAAYLDREKLNLYPNSLPASFRYAGLMSGAGAIIDLNLITSENGVPSFFFHGDQDNVVPFGTAAHHYCNPLTPGWMMLFGSQSIHRHLASLNVSTQLQSFTGGRHEYAGWYFHAEQEVLLHFVQRVLAGQHFTIEQPQVGKLK